MPKKQKYKEGSWFAVPLETDEFAVGLIARYFRGVLLVYFFGKTFSSIPDLSELEKYQPSDAIKVIKVGDLGFHKGEWKVIGELPDWKRSVWIIPDFVRREPVSDRCWLVKYADDNPNLILSEERVSEDAVKNLETDGLFGYKSAEKILSKILN